MRLKTDEFALCYRRYLGKVRKYFAQMMRQSLPLVLGAVLLLIWWGVLYKNAAPRAATVAMTVAKGQIERRMTSAAMSSLQSISEDHFCRVEYDENGMILAVTADAAKVGMAQGRVLEAVNAELSEINRIRVSIPIGTMIGGEVLSGRGFGMRVVAKPYCRLSVSTESCLESAGINQVGYRILLRLHVDVTLICMGKSDDFFIEITLPLSESLLVGKVPDGFFFDGSEKS